MKIVTLTYRAEFEDAVQDETAVASTIEICEQGEWSDDNIQITHEP